MESFSARIFIISKINPVVDVPEDVLKAIFEQAGKTRGPMPVRGRLNGAEFIQTLIKYAGRWRLYLNGPMREAAGIDTGDIADVEIEYDPRPREEPMPRKFAEALDKDDEARAEFGKLSPSRQKEILRYLNSMKTGESLLRNVEKIIRHLTGKPTDKLHALMRKEK
jgi:Bacteriocin-protection, YdeI or OmpD-Associated/Domain of unknown function (DUF1905)